MSIKCNIHKQKLILIKLDVFGKKKNILACPQCYKPKLQDINWLIQEVRN